MTEQMNVAVVIVTTAVILVIIAVVFLRAVFSFAVRASRRIGLSNAKKTVAMLNPGCNLTYYAEYSDGCHTSGMVTAEGLYFEGQGGPVHAPHSAFHPGDKPVYEWGQKGLLHKGRRPQDSPTIRECTDRELRELNQ